MDKRKYLCRILNNSQNVKFHEFIVLVESFGFKLARTSGSHHIYKNANIAELVNLQNVNGQATPYQIRQFLSLVEKNNLELED